MWYWNTFKATESSVCSVITQCTHVQQGLEWLPCLSVRLFVCDTKRAIWLSQECLPPFLVTCKWQMNLYAPHKQESYEELCFTTLLNIPTYQFQYFLQLFMVGPMMSVCLLQSLHSAFLWTVHWVKCSTGHHLLTTATKQQHLNCIHEVCGVAQSYLPYMQWKQN